MLNNKNVEIYVYFIDNKYKFCINDELVEFDEIISALRKATTKDEKECSSENLLYKLIVTIVTDSGGDDTSGFTLELKIKPIETNLKIEPIILIISNSDGEYSFTIQSHDGKNESKADCNDIFDVLIVLIKDLINMNTKDISDEGRAILDELAARAEEKKVFNVERN